MAGPASGALQHVVDARQQPVPGRQEQRWDRGCPGSPTPSPTRRQPSSSGVRQSTPMTVPPASRWAAQEVAGPGAEVDEGDAQVARGRRRSASRGAARARDSRPRRARPPTSRRSAGPGPRPRPARAGSRAPPRPEARPDGARPRGRRTSAPSSARSWPSDRPRSRSDARVKGAPAKPMRGTVELARAAGGSPRAPCRAPRAARSGGGPRCRRGCAPASRCAGPSPATKSKGMPMGARGKQQVAEEDRRVDVQGARWAAA